MPSLSQQILAQYAPSIPTPAGQVFDEAITLLDQGHLTRTTPNAPELIFCCLRRMRYGTMAISSAVAVILVVETQEYINTLSA